MQKSNFYRLRFLGLMIGLATFYSVLTGCYAAGAITETALISTTGRAVLANALAVESVAGTGTAALLRQAIVASAAGGLVIANNGAANTVMSRIRLKRAAGQRNKIYFEGQKPFAEIHPEKGKMYIYREGIYVDIPNNLYVVKGKTVNIRDLRTNGVIATVKEGDLLVVLGKRPNGYEIKTAKGQSPVSGWVSDFLVEALSSSIQAKSQSESYVAPAPAPKPKPYDCAEMMTGDYGFTNNTQKFLHVVLYTEDTPVEFQGNPGQTVIELTLQPGQTQYFYKISAKSYRYWIFQDKEYDKPKSEQISYRGYIEVETCKKLVFDIK